MTIAQNIFKGIAPIQGEVTSKELIDIAEGATRAYALTTVQSPAVLDTTRNIVKWDRISMDVFHLLMEDNNL